jgi:hypothetical protein
MQTLRFRSYNTSGDTDPILEEDLLKYKHELRDIDHNFAEGVFDFMQRKRVEISWSLVMTGMGFLPSALNDETIHHFYTNHTWQYHCSGKNSPMVTLKIS